MRILIVSYNNDVQYIFSYSTRNQNLSTLLYDFIFFRVRDSIQVDDISSIIMLD